MPPHDPMAPDRWTRTERLFHGALALPAAERGAYLDREAAEPDLRAEVLALLDAHEAAGPLSERLHVTSFLSEFADHLPPGVAPAAEAAPSGSRVGPYRLLREVGRGGMGTVHLAERADGAFLQQVALKLIRPDLPAATAGSVRARFLRERTVLAGLEHPAIARLLGGGETDTGDPYFAMEFVDGKPVTDYCDERALPLRERIALFLQVCEAVAYAHRRLVVHRDLKPSNVLVAEGDAGPTVKLLDFGIAKLLDATDEQTQITGAVRPFTPDYAAPEQVDGGPVGTEADVWALGVLLHRLLAGRRPFPARPRTPSRGAAPAEPPSRSATREGNGDEAPAAEVALDRGATPDRLRRALAGDLDAIVGRCLRPKPEDRYPSVDALAADLRRHLHGEPVEARRGTRTYVAARFVRRHRWGVSAALIGVATLVGFAGVLAVENRETARAQARAEATADFLAGLFEGASPTETLGREVTARELLDAGLLQLRSADLGVEVRVRLLSTVGEVYSQLGVRDSAVAVLREALALHRRTPGAPRLDAAEAHAELGHTYVLLGQFADAAPHLEAAYAIRREELGADALETAEAAQDLGALLTSEGDFEAARRWHRRALAAYRSHPEAPDALARGLAEAGSTELTARSLDDADRLLTEAITIRSRVLPPDHPDLGHSLHTVGTLRYQQGRLDEAGRLLRRAVDARRRVLGGDSLRLVSSLNDLALVERTKGDFDGAERAFREVLQIQRRIAPDNAEMIATTLHNLGWTLSGAGRLDEAEPLFRESLALNRRALGDDHLSTSFQWMELGRIEVARGRPSRALPFLDRALRVREGAVDPGSVLILQIQAERARALAALGRSGEARRLLQDVVRDGRALGEAGAKYTADAEAQLAALRDA